MKAMPPRSKQDEIGQMKNLLKLGLIVCCAMVASLSLLGLVLSAGFKMKLSDVMQKMNSELTLYLFPTVILLEFCFFINALLAHLSKKHLLNLGFDFSEVRFTYDLDNSNTTIPLRIKLQQLYPLSIALTLLGFVLVLMSR
jgi:hypothetical protein